MRNRVRRHRRRPSKTLVGRAYPIISCYAVGCWRSSWRFAHRERGSTFSRFGRDFLAASLLFVYRSVYKMRIEVAETVARARVAA